MATPKSPVLPTNVYLLTLVGPEDEMPCGLFLTEKDALVWASDHSCDRPPNEATGDLYDCYVGAYGWRGQGPTEKPFGYRITRFENGKPKEHAVVEPFVEYTPQKSEGIDPEQELKWN